jgi:sodium-dependent dicarboxylate transporter 2/3/5
MSEAAGGIVPEQGEFDNQPEDRNPPRPSRSVWILRALGLGAALLVYALLGNAELSRDARVVAAVATLMAIWWMTEAIPLSATSLLPIILFPLLTDRSVAQATAPYANPIVFLFLGGFLLAIAMQKVNLHRRIALQTLRAVGTHPRQIILGMMISTAFLSMWVSNTATTLMMLPIALSVLALVAENSDRAKGVTVDVRAGLAAGHKVSDLIHDKDVRVFGVGLVLAIAWSASIGGLGTLLGSPPNAIVAGYISKELGKEVGFAQWMMLGVPIVVCFIALAWLLITRVLFRFKLDEVPGGKQMIEGEIAELGPLSRGEKSVRLVFLLAAFCWIVPSLLSTVGDLGQTMPWLRLFNDTVVALSAGLLLFGGGLSLAASVASSGLDKWFGQQVVGLGVLPIVALIAAVTLIVLFLTEITSNTATAATFIPILGGVAVGIGIDPMTLLIPAALAATCAFMLPVGTPPNAIVFGTGAVSIVEMARGGLLLNLVGVVLITLFTVVLGPWALGLIIR